MKRIIAIIFYFGAFLNLSSAQEYSIFKVEGKVMVLSHQTTEWKPAQKHATISKLDKVKLTSGSSLSIVDIATNRIISSAKTGEYTVSDFSQKATKKSESLFRSLNKILVRDIKKESVRNNHYSTYGATMRGIHDKADYADSLYASIYSAIISSQPAIEAPVSFKKITITPETFCFGVKNDTEETLFINVLRVTKSDVCFCYSFTYDNFGVLPVTAHSSADLSGYPFVESDECRYVLVATSRPYKIASLQYLLQNMEKPEYDTPADSVYIVEL